MQPYLILVRHAAVHIDPSIPSLEWPLSADGRSRCHSLAPQIQPYTPTRFITSHEPKARETGQILADLLGVPCASAAGLQEHDRSGVPYFANKVDFETAVANFFARPDELVFGGETAVQARNRFATAVQQQLGTYPQDTLAIVAHGTVLTLFLCHHNPLLEPLPFWQSLALPCAFVVTLPEMALVTAV